MAFDTLGILNALSASGQLPPSLDVAPTAAPQAQVPPAGTPAPFNALNVQPGTQPQGQAPGLFDQFGAFLERPGITPALITGGLGLLEGQSGFQAFGNALQLFQGLQDRRAAQAAAQRKASLEEREQRRKEAETAATVAVKREEVATAPVERRKLAAQIVEIGADTRKTLADTEAVFGDIADNFFTTTAEEGEAVDPQAYADFVSVVRTTGTIAPVRQILSAAQDAAVRVYTGQADLGTLSQIFASQVGGLDPEAQEAQVRLFERYANAGLTKIQEALAGVGEDAEEEGALGQTIVSALTDFYNRLNETLGAPPPQAEAGAAQPPAIPQIPLQAAPAIEPTRFPF